MQAKQTKISHLDNTKNNLEMIFNNVRGDFSLIKEADVICSLGFQGTALKAASLYNKPLIFYTYNRFETEIALFSLDSKINKQINQSLNELWFYKNNLEKALDLLEEENFLRKINLSTELLLEGIGIKKQSSINNFFEGYYFETRKN